MGDDPKKKITPEGLKNAFKLSSITQAAIEIFHWKMGYIGI